MKYFKFICKLQPELHSHSDFLQTFWNKIHSPILHLTIKCFVIKKKLQIEALVDNPVIPITKVIILHIKLLKNDLFQFIFEIRFIKK